MSRNGNGQSSANANSAAAAAPAAARPPPEAAVAAPAGAVAEASGPPPAPAPPPPPPAVPFRLRPRPLIPLLTIKAAGMSIGNKNSIKCELEQMEHAFLDLDEDDPSQDEWNFRGQLHPEKVSVMFDYERSDMALFHIQFQLLQSLNDLRKQKTFCDVVVRAGSSDRELPSHKCVLAAVSNYFKAMFTAGLAESNQEVVTINGISSPILEQLLDYAYSAEIKITKSNVQGGHLIMSNYVLSRARFSQNGCMIFASAAGSRLQQPFRESCTTQVE